MSLSTFETAARTWLVNAVDDATKYVVFGDQSGSGTTSRTPPAPPEPYVTLRTTSIREVGQPEPEPSVDATGERTVYDRWQATMSCHFVGNGSRAYAIAAKRALNLDSVRTLFEEAEVGVLYTSDLQVVPEVRDGQWKQRHVFEIFLDVPDSQTETLSWIEHVEITGTLLNYDGTTLIENEFTVDLN